MVVNDGAEKPEVAVSDRMSLIRSFIAFSRSEEPVGGRRGARHPVQSPVRPGGNLLHLNRREITQVSASIDLFLQGYR